MSVEFERTFLELLKKYVTLANPGYPHPLDQRRLLDALEYASENALGITPELISKAWPKTTIETLGRDPAKSEKLFAHTLRLVEEWKQTGTIEEAAQ